MIGEPALASIPDLGLEPVDEIDHIVEPTAGAAADAASNNGGGFIAQHRNVVLVGGTGTGKTHLAMPSR
jgi:flagellar biosynthesis GTPase FlhF